MSWQISNSRIDRLIVFAELDGALAPAGELVFQGTQKRIGTFHYARSWIENSNPPLAPVDLPVRRSALPGSPAEAPLAFYDAAPDGWGTSILQRAFPLQQFGLAEKLAATGDDRIGALSFGFSPKAPSQWLPGTPELKLATGNESYEELVLAAIAADNDSADSTQLRALFRSSADIGGARPKARVRYADKEWIAKVPALGDGFDEPRIEAFCLAFAREADVDVPEFFVRPIANRSVLFVERFDRRNGRRLGYSSVATLLRQPYDQYRSDASYASIAAAARRAGIVPCEKDLFRRMLVNSFVNNTDDHLRNHAFLFDAGRWKLSPAFDIVVQKKLESVLRAAPGRQLVNDPVERFESYEAFGLERQDAEGIYADVVDACAQIGALLDKTEVTEQDRATIRPLIAHALSPPSLVSSIGWQREL